MLIFFLTIITLELFSIIKFYRFRAKTLKIFLSNENDYSSEILLLRKTSSDNEFNTFINLIAIIGVSPQEFFLGIKSNDDLVHLNRNPSIVNSSVLSNKIHQFKNKYLGFTGLLLVIYVKRNIDLLDKFRINIHEIIDAQIPENEYQKRIDKLDFFEPLDIYFSSINNENKITSWDRYFRNKKSYLNRKKAENQIIKKEKYIPPIPFEAYNKLLISLADNLYKRKWISSSKEFVKIFTTTKIENTQLSTRVEWFGKKYQFYFLFYFLNKKKQVFGEDVNLNSLLSKHFSYKGNPIKRSHISSGFNKLKPLLDNEMKPYTNTKIGRSLNDVWEVCELFFD